MTDAVDRPADALQVEVAYRELMMASAAVRGPRMTPTIEQLCAELWRKGVTMPMADVIAHAKSRGLALLGVPEEAEQPTLEAPRRVGLTSAAGTSPRALSQFAAMNPLPKLVPVAADTLDSITDRFDALVIVVPSPAPAHLPKLPGSVASALEQAFASDAALAKGPRAPAVLPVSGAPGGRVVLAVMGSLDDDVDDVRLVAESTAAAIARAVEAGARRPLLAVATPRNERFTRALDVAALAALGTHWSALEAREAGHAAPCVTDVGVIGLDAARAAYVSALEAGRTLCRDITGTDPERMAPSRVAELCRESFEGTRVKVTVTDDMSAYPLIAAVSRASMTVPRHRPCIVRLEYVPDGPVQRSLWISAKGVTYDTGGADLKTEGHMAGMSRDKGGAGAAAGLVRMLAETKQPGVRVVAMLGMVRNSVGADSYVSDEIIRARSGSRVRIGNTDAEGRLVLADLLSALATESAAAPDPMLVSIATLTGHVYRAFGPYIGALENRPARERHAIARMANAGARWGEPMEWTLPRREDYAFVAARSNAEDVVSSNRLASVNTPRGHQGPFAFLDVASGLKGGSVPFVHLDIGGVAVSPADWQFGRPTGAPIAMLAGYLASDFDAPR